MADTLASTLAAAPASPAQADRLPDGPRLAEVPPSFEQLVADQQTRVARLCYRLLGWREEIEDVVQDVFLAAFRALPEFHGRSSVSTWLTRIAVNACRDHVRRRQSRLRLFSRARARASPSRGEAVGAELEDRERLERVRQSVGKLPAKYREVVILRYLEELPVSEIGEVLGMTRNAIEVRLNRARRRLKDDLVAMLEG